MRILLLADTFNSLTQRVYAELTYRHHELSVELALSNEIICEAVELYQPDLIIAPFLTKIIPKRIWCNHVCIIIHPGIKGDRGISSLDWAIMTEAKEWGGDGNTGNYRSRCRSNLVIVQLSDETRQ